MDVGLLLEYGWVLIVLIVLEGILAADNALVMAVMVKHLPKKERKKALFYGLAGAFVFRVTALFIISFLVNIWQLQAIGAAYLIFLSINHIAKKYLLKKEITKKTIPKKQSGLWMTVFKVELADIAFAIDSILAAFALAITLPETALPQIGGMDGGQFIVVLLGGFIGVVLIRFAATAFVNLLHRRPGLETAAFLIVGWVGVKLAIHTLGHPQIAFLPQEFLESTIWKVGFWIVLIAIAASGFFLSKPKQSESISQDHA